MKKGLRSAEADATGSRIRRRANTDVWQEDAIRRTICDKRPEQLKMEFAL